MYCSTCGAAVAQGLSYCKHCGGKLNGDKDNGVAESSEIKPESLIRAMTSVFVLGILAITVLIGVMKAILNLNDGQILGFATFSFLIMLLLESVFIWLLLRRKRGPTAEAGNAVLSKGQVTKELDEAQARLLQEPVTSVTEHTTRTLEPIYSERKTK